MLLNYSIKGYKVFYDEVLFSMEANNYIKKNRENLIVDLGDKKNINVVKSSFIYGPNNSGKSCFIDSLKFVINLIKNEKFDLKLFDKNLFYSKEDPISFKIEYLVNSRKYFYELTINQKEIINEVLECNDESILNRKDPSDEIREIYNLIGVKKDKLYVFLLPEKYEYMAHDLKSFINSFEFVKSDDEIDVDKILDERYLNEILKIVPLCDLNIDKIVNRAIEIKEIFPDKKEDLIKHFMLFSELSFKNMKKEVPFFLISSEGTSKVTRLVYTFLKAINENKILVMDEFETSLHTIMSKALITFFNSQNNRLAQLIATTHDLLLLDDEYLLRRDQIWFIYKDENGNYLYSLNDFKDNSANDPRGNVMIKYLKGIFGALPKPNLDEVNDVQ